jgi:hypothetical protein
VNAEPETAFDVYTDHRRYADLLTMIRSVTLEREGDPPPNGSGAIRRIHLTGATVREQITQHDHAARYSYRMLSDAPLDKFEATVEFAPAENGTSVTYFVTAVSSIKGLPVKWPSEEAIRMFMHAAAEAAEQRGDNTGRFRNCFRYLTQEDD